MKNSIKTIIYFSIISLFLISCQTSKEKIEKQINELEKETSAQYNVEKMDSLSLLYQQYISEFPQDSMIAEYLYKSGRVNMILGRGAEALSDFTNLINKFPNHVHLPEAYYYKAFIYEDIMYDIALARVAYFDFINRYPNHKLVQDATLSIQYLGKSPAEIVASFEQEKDSSIVEE
jgi:outer membrane protein assembly factor BamD (BamD/ComL family)